MPPPPFPGADISSAAESGNVPAEAGLFRPCKISVVVPVFRAAGTLEACVWSVLAQDDFPEIELILVDDASPDASGELCDKLAGTDARVRVLHLKKNGGAAMARGRGVEIARGEWIMFVDSDDRLLPHALSVLWRATEKFPDADLVEGCALCEKADGKLKLENRGACEVDALGYLSHLHVSSAPFGTGPWGKILRRRLFCPEARAFEWPRAMPVYCEDWLMLVSLASRIRKAVKIEDVVYFYARSETGLVRAAKEIKKGKGIKLDLCCSLLVRRVLIREFGWETGNKLFFIQTRTLFIRAVAKQIDEVDPLALKRWAKKFSLVRGIDVLARLGIFIANLPENWVCRRKLCAYLLRRLLRVEATLRHWGVK